MGNFSYPINITTEGAIKVVIEGEEGHKASIVANRVSAQATNNNDNALMLVREDISKLKDKILPTRYYWWYRLYCWHFRLMGID